MDYPNNYTTSDTLRLEIAICQQDIDIYEPGKVIFTIPAIISNDNIGITYTGNYNIANKKNTSTPSIGVTTLDNTVKLTVPKEYTRWYGADIIPKGTKFIVAFIGGNMNDIKIIGRYDSID